MTRPARPLPEHGSRACYMRGCRRPECCEANRRYGKRYNLDRARTGRRRVDSGPATIHVRELTAAGWSLRQIAASARIPHRTVKHLLDGSYAVLNANTSRRVLAARPSPTLAPARTYVDSTGTVRRIRALMAIGHTLTRICEASGLSKEALSQALNRGRRVTAEHAAAVDAAYTRLSGMPGTNARAKNRARREGWHGPLAWGDNIDDPKATPDTGDLPDLPAHRLAASLADEVQHLARYGVPAEEIAARVDRSVSYVRAQLSGQRGPGWRQREQAGEVAS